MREYDSTTRDVKLLYTNKVICAVLIFILTGYIVDGFVILTGTIFDH